MAGLLLAEISSPLQAVGRGMTKNKKVSFSNPPILKTMVLKALILKPLVLKSTILKALHKYIRIYLYTFLRHPCATRKLQNPHPRISVSNPSFSKP